MSTGSTIVPVRIPAAQLAHLRETIARRNLHRPGDPWTLSDAIRVLCAREQRKMQRSREKRAKR